MIGKLRTWLILLLVFLLPVWVLPISYDWFEIPKAYLFYSISSGVLFLTCIELIKTRTFYLPRSGALTAAFVFLLSQWIALLFSVHPLTSLLGNYFRFSGGVLELTLMFLLSLIWVDSAHRDPEYNTILLKVIALTALVTSVISIGMQGAYHYLFSQRLYGTFGQPDFLAAWVSVTIPVSIYLATEKKEGVWRFMWMGISILSVVAVLATFSRAAIIAMVVSALLTGFYFLRHHKKKMVLSGTVFILAITLFIYKVPAISSRFNSHNFSELTTEQTLQGTTSLRLLAWSGTADAILHRPVLGYGPDTLLYVFPEFRPRRINDHIEWAFRFDRAHSDILEIAFGSGLLGLALYLIFLVVCIRQQFTKGVDSRVSILVTSVIVMYVVNHLFSFPTSATLLLFWMIVAIGIGNTKVRAVPRRVPASLLLVGVLLSLGSVMLTTRVYVADLLLSFGKIEQAIAVFPYRDVYYGSLATRSADLGDFTGALVAADRAVQLNPHYTENYTIRADVKVKAGMASLAIADFEIAHLLDPTSPYILYKEAQAYIDLKDNAKARECLLSALQQKRDFTPASDLLTRLGN
ncbi:MAG: O-antigen ligase family protein [Patescibacteria group bacterium]